MSEIFKAFSDIPALKLDGSNYTIWNDRVTMTSRGCGVGEFLTKVAPSAREKEWDALLAVIMGKLPDTVFATLRDKTELSEVITALKARCGRTTAITEAHGLQRLYSLQCNDPK